MKKYITPLLITLLFFSSNLYCQESSTGFLFGGGITFPVSKDAGIKKITEGRANGLLGFYKEFDINESIDIRLETNLSAEGLFFKGTHDTNSVQLSNWFIQFPILLQFKPLSKMNFSAGPFYAYRFGSVNRDGLNRDIEYESETIAKSYFGLIAESGFQLHRWKLALRGTYNITSFNKGVLQNSGGDNPKITTLYMSLLVSFQLNK